MHLRGTRLATLATVFFAASALASEMDIAEEIQAGFKGVLFPRQNTNLQAFTGALAGAAAPAITQSGDSKRPFEVDGDTFTDFQSAADRACDNQKNKCADAVNSKQASGIEVSDCDEQNNKCKSTAQSATQTSFSVLTSSTADFDIFCDS